MFLVQKTTPNRLDIEVGAPFDTETMRAGLDDLLEKSKGISGGVMFYRITSVGMPTLGAIMVEMRRLPELLGLLKQFDKCAVISDAAWIRTAAQVEGAVLPGLEIRSYAMDEIEPAEAWLAALDEPDDEYNGPI